MFKMKGIKMASIQITLKRNMRRTWRKEWPLYVMLLPGVVWFIVFRYIPMAGSIIAFQDYSIFKGITESPFVGLKHFETLFTAPDFKRVMLNTVVLAGLKIGVMFPLPILLAIMLNEVKNLKFKKLAQTIVYIPHFLSWVIVSSLVFDMLSIDGIVNQITSVFGMEPVLYMQKQSAFRMIYLISGVWKEVGYGTIVYLAAISSISEDVYEAARIDGASRMRQIRSITLPLMVPTILTLLLLNIGQFMELGFDQVYTLLTPMTQNVGDILETYIFRVGIQSARYSYTTAMGLFQSLIGFALVMIFNRIANKHSESGGLW